MSRVDCHYFRLAQCRSCRWIERDYADQLAAKLQYCRERLPGIPESAWIPPCASPLSGFRNKAKMAVGGSIEAPSLGLVDVHNAAVDLADCLLYPPALQAAFEPLREFIRAARVAPYDVAHSRGELKFILITLDDASQGLMVRFVLRSREAIGRMQKQLPGLLAALPGLQVATANLQPRHAAVLEGETEIHLAGADTLEIGINHVRLWLQPGGFWQTNTVVAAALYREAADWAAAVAPHRVLDLYCGIGGFALHLAGPGREVLGLESNAAAVASAGRAAAELAWPVGFREADASALGAAEIGSFDLVVVNPPRRGVGAGLCRALQRAGPPWLIYSSCNPDSLALDLARLPGYGVHKARLFDMFPHTSHSEVLLLLRRRDEHPGGAT